MFIARNLSVLAYAQGFTLWHYKAEGSVDETAKPDFFDEAHDMLAQGDMMLVSASDGGRVLFAGASARGARMHAVG